MQESTDPLEWEYRAWEKDPQRRYVALFAMAVAAAAGIALLHHPLFAVIGIVVVFVSTAELFLPVKHRIDANEASQRCGISVTAIRWTDVKRLIPQSDGVRLSPFDRPQRLDAFRGVFLRYAGNEEQVLGKIRALWQIDGSSLEGTIDAGSDGGTGGEACTSHPQATNGDASDLVP